MKKDEIFFEILKDSLHLFMAKKKSTAGRKPVEPQERAVLVGFYTKQSIIDGLGGKDSVRKMCKEFIENK